MRLTVSPISPTRRPGFVEIDRVVDRILITPLVLSRLERAVGSLEPGSGGFALAQPCNPRRSGESQRALEAGARPGKGRAGADGAALCSGASRPDPGDGWSVAAQTNTKKAR